MLILTLGAQKKKPGPSQSPVQAALGGRLLHALVSTFSTCLLPAIKPANYRCGLHRVCPAHRAALFTLSCKTDNLMGERKKEKPSMFFGFFFFSGGKKNFFLEIKETRGGERQGWRTGANDLLREQQPCLLCSAAPLCAALPPGPFPGRDLVDHSLQPSARERFFISLLHKAF